MMHKRRSWTIAILLLVPLIVVLYAASSVRGQTDWDSAAFLLAVSALAASISGIGFAIYGFFNVTLVEDIVDRNVQDRLAERLSELDLRFQSLQEQFRKESIQAQEAIQKIIAGYNRQFQSNDLDGAISLYQQAVCIWPKVYNGFTSLAYAYQQKGDIINARKNFELAIKEHPESFQCLNDMARFLATQGEVSSAYEYLEKTLEIAPGAWADIVVDTSFDYLRKKYPLEFDALINQAKKRSEV